MPGQLEAYRQGALSALAQEAVDKWQSMNGWSLLSPEQLRRLKAHVVEAMQKARELW